MCKRVLDVAISLVSLLLLSPLFILLAALIKLDSRGPVFFRQERVGRDFRPFRIYKFRTMARGLGHKSRPITYGDDPRITRVGRWLRLCKMDELPQLINVLKGEMSLVGPRPELARYVALLREDYAQILRVRPGITDLASIRFRQEAELLGRSPDPESEYVKKILPEKIRMAKEYLRRSSLFFDLGLILKTVFFLVRDGTDARKKRR